VYECDLYDHVPSSPTYFATYMLALPHEVMFSVFLSAVCATAVPDEVIFLFVILSFLHFCTGGLAT
jgi:hypothetical protein